MKYRVTKTYGHDRGLSATFRQHRARSHCQYVHGYALAFSLTFEADTLDESGWVIDFGGLKEVKAWLDRTFDHVTLVAADDPKRELFEEMAIAGLVQCCIVPATGCEAFARLVFNHVNEWMQLRGHSPRVRLVHVTVREHEGNAASVVPEQDTVR